MNSHQQGQQIFQDFRNYRNFPGYRWVNWWSCIQRAPKYQGPHYSILSRSSDLDSGICESRKLISFCVTHFLRWAVTAECFRCSPTSSRHTTNQQSRQANRRLQNGCTFDSSRSSRSRRSMRCHLSAAAPTTSVIQRCRWPNKVDTKTRINIAGMKHTHLVLQRANSYF
jgi:hypothetical protein